MDGNVSFRTSEAYGYQNFMLSIDLSLPVVIKGNFILAYPDTPKYSSVEKVHDCQIISNKFVPNEQENNSSQPIEGFIEIQSVT